MEHIWKGSEGRACQNTFRRIFLLFFFVHPCHTPTLVYFFFFFFPKWEGATAWVPRELGFRLRWLRKIHKDFGKVTFTQKGL